MIAAASLREFVRGARSPLAIAAVIGLLATGGAPLADALAYGREALAAGQWWRALSGHFVHLGPVHAALNLGGLIALLLMCPTQLRAGEWLRRIVVLSLAISALLYATVPAVDRYVGFSGVLHGLFLLGLVGHSLVDVAARTFYAHQDARTPLWLAAVTLAIFIGAGVLLTKTSLGFAGLALANAVAFSVEAALMLLILYRRRIL